MLLGRITDSGFYLCRYFVLVYIKYCAVKWFNFTCAIKGQFLTLFFWYAWGLRPLHQGGVAGELSWVGSDLAPFLQDEFSIAKRVWLLCGSHYGGDHHPEPVAGGGHGDLAVWHARDREGNARASPCGCWCGA